MVTRVLEFQPNCSQALVARAKCYEQCGDLQAALRDVTTVLATRPGDRDIQAWRLNINIKLQAGPSAEKPSHCCFFRPPLSTPAQCPHTFDSLGK